MAVNLSLYTQAAARQGVGSVVGLGAAGLELWVMGGVGSGARIVED
jgi:hypothetical protein